MKLKALSSLLSSCPSFSQPRAHLEQYATPPDAAARLVHAAAARGHLDGASVLDLGCGTGMLLAGALLAGAAEGTGADLDSDALGLAAAWFRSMDLEGRFLVSDVGRPPFRPSARFDTVIMNPPFGSQARGADRPFMDAAMAHGDIIYSFHNMKGSDFVLGYYSRGGFDPVLEDKYLFSIPHMFGFHRKERATIEVALIRSERSG